MPFESTPTSPKPAGPWRGRCWLFGWLAVSLGLLWAAAPMGRPAGPAVAAEANTAGRQPEATSRRTKNIEDVVVGDRVLAMDPATGRQEPKRVVATYRRVADHLRILQVRSIDGERSQELKTTDEHPFWVPGTGWVEARNLNVGDELRRDDGTPAMVEGTRHEAHPEGVPVFNFQVEDYHSYFVAQAAGDGPVLVHNASNSNILGKNVMATRGIQRQKGYASRHIVAVKESEAGPARSVLARAGIDINDAANGVYLPYTKKEASLAGLPNHRKLHTVPYYEEVNRRLLAAPPGRAAVEAVLSDIRMDLLNNVFPF